MSEIIAVMQKKEQSLRERRREQTWTAIHEAALKRVREHGMRGTTVEEIAQEAGVSPRTFFNYFPSKEDAVLGLREPVVSEESSKQTATTRMTTRLFVSPTFSGRSFSRVSTTPRAGTLELPIRSSPSPQNE